MKCGLFVLALPLASVIAGPAMVVHLRDGGRDTIALEQILRITFDATGVQTVGGDAPVRLALNALPDLLAAGQAGVRVTYEVVRGASDVEVRVVNAAGKVVRTMDEGMRRPGAWETHWDCRSKDGPAVPSGAYMLAVYAAGTRVKTALVVVP